MKYFRSIVAFVGLVGASASILVVTFLVGLLDPTRRLGWLSTRLWAWTVLLTGGVQSLRARGFENLDGIHGVVVMSNHESLFDPVVVMALSSAPLRFLARHELFYLPVLGWAMWSNGHLAVRRGSRRTACASFRRAARAIANRDRVVVYPEGSRAATTDLLPFKEGGFLLALRCGVPIIPVGITGTRRVCPKGWHWAGFGPVSAVVGTPIETRSYRRETLPELMGLVRERILELRVEALRLNARPRALLEKPASGLLDVSP